MRHGWQRIAGLTPLGLAVLGAIVPLVGSGFTVWGLGATWLVVVATVAIARAAARPQPSPRVFLDVVGLVMTILVLAPEGGWWFVPAVASQLVLDRRAARGTVEPAAASATRESDA
jgi:hypothetical protein